MKALILLFVFFFTGCASSQKSFKIEGNYYLQGKGYSYELVINSSDSTFELTERHLETKAKCNGKWTILLKDSIRLNCFPDTNIVNQMSTGYMWERERSIVVLNSKKLLLDGFKLKKK